MEVMMVQQMAEKLVVKRVVDLVGLKAERMVVLRVALMAGRRVESLDEQLVG